MKRPILDQIASTIFKLENDRVASSSVLDEKGRNGEPMEWSESSSLTNRFSEIMADYAYPFKQWIADIIAGDYDNDAVDAGIEKFVATPNVPVVLYSFTTCPFCRRAKDYLEAEGIKYRAVELDTLDGNEGNEIRAALGRRTKRTSVPSIFVKGKYIGGCNDGPGLLPLGESGELKRMLSMR